MELTLSFDYKKEIHFFDTNISTLDASDTTDADFQISFELFEDPITQNFINLWSRSLQQFTTKKLAPQIFYNYYGTPEPDLQKLKTALNDTISLVNEFNPGLIDADLRMNMQSLDIENEKLNQLHFIFESERVKPTTNDSPLFHNCLWVMNNYIHSIETYNEYLTHQTRSWHLTLGIPSDLEELPSKEFYENFQFTDFGGLYIDYATIGKNIADCFYSNDVELIQRGELKQQQKIRPIVHIDMTPRNESLEETHKKFATWLETNHVGRYIDLENPLYKPGKFKIGQLKDHHMTPELWFSRLHSFSAIRNIEIKL